MQPAAKTPFLRLGTRGSPLALAQAREVAARLASAHGVDGEDIEIVVIKTSGDRIQNRPLSEAGGKGLFTKEIEEALCRGRIDLAVHSSKDVPGLLPTGLRLSAFLPREDVRDAFISLLAPSLDELPHGARLGTSSLRRAAQMKRHRPDLEVVPFRGNVGTRLDKLASGVADATLLAAAGLHRLHEAGRITAYLDPRAFPPAPAQGAICIETDFSDGILEKVMPLNDPETALAVGAERALLAKLDGSCRTPVAALSQLGESYALYAQLLSPDGQRAFEVEISGSPSEGIRIGVEAAEALIGQAGPEFLDAMRRG